MSDNSERPPSCFGGKAGGIHPAAATSMLRGMLIMDVQRGAMLGQRPAPDAQEIAARAKACAKVFLDGCRTKSDGQAAQ